jgi:hypothetical protein
MDFLSFVAVAMVILAVCAAMVIAYTQQTRRLRSIEEQIAKIEDTKPEILRQERAQWLDPLITLEATLNQSKEPQLDEAALQQIDAARVAVKDITARLQAAREWMGPPYDLEWAEYLERMPTLKRLYMAAGFETDPASPSSSHIIEQ